MREYIADIFTSLAFTLFGDRCDCDTCQSAPLKLIRKITAEHREKDWCLWLGGKFYSAACKVGNR
jgi:hypothetical protein